MHLGLPVSISPLPFLGYGLPEPQGSSQNCLSEQLSTLVLGLMCTCGLSTPEVHLRHISATSLARLASSFSFVLLKAKHALSNHPTMSGQGML